MREHEDVAAGTTFGGELKVRGASPDLSHVVLTSAVSLAEGAAANGLYGWSGGDLRPLSVLPDDEGGEAVAAQEGRDTVSEDGSRVFWKAAGGGLYMRDTVRGETIRLDRVQKGGFGTGEARPAFQGASADGSLAFFSDTQNLTPDANEEGADLYRWTAPGTHGCEAPGGCLADLTAEVADFGEFAESQGTFGGVARDGSRAYFIARGVLAANSGGALDPATGEPEKAVSGESNLYAWSEGEGTRFIATLSGTRAAQASPSGRYLAFMSKLPLSGYDNRDAASGERAQEVFATTPRAKSSPASHATRAAPARGCGCRAPAAGCRKNSTPGTCGGGGRWRRCCRRRPSWKPSVATSPSRTPLRAQRRPRLLQRGRLARPRRLQRHRRRL